MMNRGLYTSANLHWGTPHSVFVALDQEFDFDLDPCPGEASRFGPEMVPRREFASSESPLKPAIRTLNDGLSGDWGVFRSAFVNPPYGRSLAQWIQRARDEFIRATQYRRDLQADAIDWRPLHVRTRDRGWVFAPAPKVVLLIPARTDTAWWHDLVLPNAREIRFLRGRIGFTGIASKPERDRQKQRSRAPFPSVVVVMSDAPQ